MNKQATTIEKFRALHESGCFVLPNPWDTGTAVYLQHLGFQALATTSAGFAFARALPDSVLAIERDEMLAHVREIAFRAGAWRNEPSMSIATTRRPIARAY